VGDYICPPDRRKKEKKAVFHIWVQRNTVGNIVGNKPRSGLYEINKYYPQERGVKPLVVL